MILQPLSLHTISPKTEILVLYNCIYNVIACCTQEFKKKKKVENVGREDAEDKDTLMEEDDNDWDDREG